MCHSVRPSARRPPLTTLIDACTPEISRRAFTGAPLVADVGCRRRRCTRRGLIKAVVLEVGVCVAVGVGGSGGGGGGSMGGAHRHSTTGVDAPRRFWRFPPPLYLSSPSASGSPSRCPPSPGRPPADLATHLPTRPQPHPTDRLSGPRGGAFPLNPRGGGGAGGCCPTRPAPAPPPPRPPVPPTLLPDQLRGPRPPPPLLASARPPCD